VTQTFNILLGSDEVLNIAVLTRGSREDGIVNDDALDGLIGVGFNDCLFNLVLFNNSEVELEAARKSLASGFCGIIDNGGRENSHVRLGISRISIVA
jgi:hypothetical protein